MFKNLIKCHFFYSFNKTIILMMMLIITLNSIYNFTIVIGLDSRMDTLTLYRNYLDASFSFINFIANIFIMSIFSFSFLRKQDQYSVLLMTSKISKTIIFLSKYFTIIIISFLFCLIELICFYLPAIFLNKITYIDRNIIFSFFDLFIEMIFYGNVSLILILLTDNFYLILIPITVYLFSYNYILSHGKIEGVLKMVISLNPSMWRLYQEYGLVFFLIFLLIIGSLKIYLENEC